MKALLIQFNPRNGQRAGGINPKDAKLQCYGWQNLDSVPALEIRVIEDNRDMAQFENIEGVKILDGIDEINAAIQANIPSKFKIIDMSLVTNHMAQKGLKLDKLRGKNYSEIAEYALANNIAGVIEIKPQLVV
ncbi:hypothetical protein ES705_37546 [subsurface metagenome]